MSVCRRRITLTRRAVCCRVSLLSVWTDPGVGRRLPFSSGRGGVPVGSPGGLGFAAAGPKRLLSGAEPVVVDGWLLYPLSWGVVCRAVDEGSAGGRRQGDGRGPGSAGNPVC